MTSATEKEKKSERNDCRRQGQRAATCAFLALLFASGLLRAQVAMPSVPPPSPLALPVPMVRVLPNGLTVAVVERHAVPLVSLEVAIETGAEGDPPSLPGTANMTAALLSEGTDTRSGFEIAQSVDQMGASLDTGAGWDESYARLTVLSTYTAQAFDLLADMTRHPAFSRAEFARTKRQLLSALDVTRTDPAYLADTALRVFLYAGTPYGHPLNGTRESIERMTPASLKAFHKEFYRPSNTIILAVGEVEPEAAFRLAGQYFGDWKASPPPPRVQVRPPASTSREVVVIDDPDAVQTEIRAGCLAPSRASPEFDTLTVLNQVFGGPAANRLFNALRSERGLAYGASAKLEGYRSIGGWVASTSTRTAETAKSLRVMLDEIRRFHEGTVRPSELEAAQSYLIGHQAVEFESYDEMVRRMLKIMLYGLPLGEWNRFPASVGSLRVAEVNQVAKEFLDPKREDIVLVGDAEKFQKDLKHLGPVRVIPLAQLDFNFATLERDAAPLDGKNP